MKPVTVEQVVGTLRRSHFATLATTGDDGQSHSAGVSYAVSSPGAELVLYVMTRAHLQKARDIAREPRVSMVVPLSRRLLWFLPPPTIQLRGRAEILDWTDEAGTDAFRHFWMGRRILEAYRASRRQGESRICFVKISPEPLLRTYMVGANIWELRDRAESGAAKVLIPSGRTDA